MINDDGELVENTIILDDGSVIFIDEHRMDDDEMEQLDYAISFLEKILHKYGSINVFDLMDVGITTREMHKYLCALRVMDKHGMIDGDGDIPEIWRRGSR